ncbi:RNA-directed DNA polymerase, eukaryota [Tanacetum coccineum]
MEPTLPVLPRLDRLDRLLELLEKKHAQSRRFGSITANNDDDNDDNDYKEKTVNHLSCKTLSSALYDVHQKGTLIDRVAMLENRVLQFSVHSARTFIDDILLPFVGDVTRWVKVVPIKVNILAWKVCLDKLPTRLNLSLRGIDIPSIICPNCGLAGESCSHLFYSCNLARTLWRKIARWWEIDIPDFSCYEEWIAWFKTTRFSKAQKEMLEGVFYVMWWMIWKFRNQVLFGSSHPRMELLFDDIVSYSFTWCSNRCKNNIDWISWMKCPKSISL